MVNTNKTQETKAGRSWVWGQENPISKNKKIKEELKEGVILWELLW